MRPIAFRELGILTFVVVLCAVLGAVEPRFLSVDNLASIAVGISILAIVAAGQTVVVLSRNLDLSVGSVLGLSAMAAGIAVREHPGIGVVAVLGLAVAVGLGAGLVNGAVTAAGVPSIITTLGTLAIFRGLVFVMSDSRQVDPNDIPEYVTDLARTSPAGLPWLVPIAAAVLAVTAYGLRFTRTGRQVYALGSNPEAAPARGVRVRRLTVGVFALSGAVAGLGGALYAARFGTVNPADAGLGFELSVIAAVVIGGTRILGGSGSVLGTLLGCLLVGVIANGLTVTGVPGFWQQTLEGVIILVAVIVDSDVRRRLDMRGGPATRVAMP